MHVSCATLYMSVCAIMAGMQPFIPAKDLAYFEHFIASIGLTDNQANSAPTGRGLRLVTAAL